MPGPSPPIVTLAREVRNTLAATVRAATSPQRSVLRAQIVLLAGEGWSVARTSRDLHVTVSTREKRRASLGANHRGKGWKPSQGFHHRRAEVA